MQQQLVLAVDPEAFTGPTGQPVAVEETATGSDS